MFIPSPEENNNSSKEGNHHLVEVNKNWCAEVPLQLLPWQWVVPLSPTIELKCGYNVILAQLLAGWACLHNK